MPRPNPIAPLWFRSRHFSRPSRSGKGHLLAAQEWDHRAEMKLLPLQLEEIRRQKEDLEAQSRDTGQRPHNEGYLNNFAGLLRDLGRYDDAELVYREWLNEIVDTQGRDSAADAVQLSNLAGLLVQQGRVALAEALYLESLEVTGRLLGPTSPAHALRPIVFERCTGASAGSTKRAPC